LPITRNEKRQAVAVTHAHDTARDRLPHGGLSEGHEPSDFFRTVPKPLTDTEATGSQMPASNASSVIWIGQQNAHAARWTSTGASRNGCWSTPILNRCGRLGVARSEQTSRGRAVS
jgi:hypothetical protein